ncbi:MAG: phage portal protein [Bacteroidaceae bacterium]|nr:phage portal protein [Bacteroidaceae bacterium]
MSIFRKKQEKRSAIYFTDSDGMEVLTTAGYSTLDKNPEILTACRKIADMISSMTIYLMANTGSGDVRVINELSRKVDILPSRWYTRKTWMDFIVMNLLLYGKGNSVVIPHTSEGLLGDLEPITADRVNFVKDGEGYYITIDGVRHDPDNVLHFVYNSDKYEPWRGRGVTTTLREIANNLKQATATESGFMQSKWKPSLIIKVDALADEFASPAGRKKLLSEYIETSTVGEPWMIPAEQFSVEQIRPLSLGDLAISDVVTLDKRTVASILGVPAFVLGVGDYKADEWNAFINNTIRPLAIGIEQELTRKLIISPKMYWKFNMASLYSYDIRTLADVYSNLYIRGIVTGNEVRDRLNMQPKDGLEELVILENYIPLGSIGDQKKLIQKGEEDG